MNAIVSYLILCVCVAGLCVARAMPAPPAAWNWNLNDDEDDVFARQAKSGNLPIAAPVWFLKTGEKRGSPMSAPLWFMQTDFKKRMEQPAWMKDTRGMSEWRQRRSPAAAHLLLDDLPQEAADRHRQH